MIKKGRTRAGLSQAALARQLGVEEAVVAQLESGSLVVDHESRERVLNSCGFSTDWVQGLVRDRVRLVPMETRELQWQEGLSEARTTVEADEPSPAVSSLAWLAHCLHRLGQPTEAMHVLERAIAIAEDVGGEDRSKLHMSLALVLQDLGDLERATEEAERALALAEAEHPDKTPLRAQQLLAYARILRDRGDLTAAKAAARQSLELDQVGWLGRRSSSRNLDRDAILQEPPSN